MRTDILDKKEFIINLINNNVSKSEISRQLKCKSSTLDSYLKKMEIVYNGNKGLKGIKTSNRRNTALYYINNDITINSYKLKNKLIQDGIKQHKCECCNSEEWMGNKIPIELHHIDGNRFNNRLSNLQILCPNCHALTSNYSGRNVKSEDILKDIKVNKCKCGLIIKNRSKSCIECYSIIQRKVERPTYEDLIIDVENIGYSATGRKYGVSSNSIRKWLKLKIN